MEPIQGTVTNNAGGQSFLVSREQMLMRYLIMGSDKPTYYASSQTSTLENLDNVVQMIHNGKGLDIVQILIDVSVSARAPKQTFTLIVLAICSLSEDLQLKRNANLAVPLICRIPTHLFEYLDLRECISRHINNGSTGWGRAHRKVVSDWYNNFRGGSEKALIESTTKYASRHGYTHKDALRLSHSQPNTITRKMIYSYLTKGIESAQKISRDFSKKASCTGELDTMTNVLEYIIAVQESKSFSEDDENNMCEFIDRYNLVREHVPSILLNSQKVWIKLLEKMPLIALIRSLSKLSSLKITEIPEQTSLIIEKLTNPDIIHKSKIHPLQILLAHNTYKEGRGFKGSLVWEVNPLITKALDTAFELSFKNIVPSSKRIFNAIDVSGSMRFSCNGGEGMTITCHEASAVMALIIARTEPFCFSTSFSVDTSHSNGYYCYGGKPLLKELPIRKETTLHEAYKITQDSNFGATDCALPMLYALEKKMEIDTFIVYTDSETYYGDIHPSEALKKYRKEMNLPNTKLVVMGMQSNGFTIADPLDEGMLDVVGFDSASPQIVTDFSSNKL
jgi:60 kDa SS-A/Ro ribonucleoprotein